MTVLQGWTKWLASYESIKSKVKITVNTPAGGNAKDAKIIVP